jgi:hypothetical protein
MGLGDDDVETEATPGPELASEVFRHRRRALIH